MNAPKMPGPDWITANQNLLAAEFSRLKARLRGADGAMADAQLEAARSVLDGQAAIDIIAERFGLSGFERELLLLTGAVEMDSEIATLCAGAGGSAQYPWATFGLALAVLEEPHWSALAPMHPLRRWRLIETGTDASLTSCRLQIDERILHYLAGINYLDPRLQTILQEITHPESIAESQLGSARDIVSAMERCGPPLPVVQLTGSDLDGKRDVAACAANQLGLRLYSIDCGDLPVSPNDLDLLVVLWQREAALFDSALLIECGENEPPVTVRRFAGKVGGLTIIAGRERMALERSSLFFDVEKPGYGEQFDLWQKSLGAKAGQYGDALPGVAAEFRFSRRDILRVKTELDSHDKSSVPPEAGLWRACLRLQGRRIEGLAKRIEPCARWEDLVLPETQKSILRQIGMHLRHRSMVYEEWGFARRSTRGLGISALFAGESGTGKTMAAEVLANELHLDLYRLDLSAVVSKYIGETEKNLSRIFDAAEDSGIILLFDEADALFGKRSEVKDSHDRYANIAISYLLQRMEAYRGLAILTTNQKAALDTAFHRRLRFVVSFPFPDGAEREAIWRTIFPDSTPTEGLDYTKLARLQVAGGNIRNIALGAAFLAAEDARPVTMGHILSAAHAEATKRERQLVDAETRGWV